jgi:hypothetical protein
MNTKTVPSLSLNFSFLEKIQLLVRDLVFCLFLSPRINIAMFMFKTNDLKHSLNFRFRLRQQFTPISHKFTIVKEFHVIVSFILQCYAFVYNSLLLYVHYIYFVNMLRSPILGDNKI